MTRYAGFLLGINVGKRQVKMALLKKSLEEIGCTGVHTLLASGNVVFDSVKAKTALKKEIEEQLQTVFGFTIQIILRPYAAIADLVAHNPFKKIAVTKSTRLYVTFFSEKPESTVPGGDDSFRIVNKTDTELCSVVELSQSGTTNTMDVLKKTFGKNITTRNWNTILKIAALES